jgi:hypothetical protein
MRGQEPPYLARIEIEIWAWEHPRATEVFKNLCDDVAKLSHRFAGGSHGFPPPRSMELVQNPDYRPPEYPAA